MAAIETKSIQNVSTSYVFYRFQKKMFENSAVGNLEMEEDVKV